MKRTTRSFFAGAFTMLLLAALTTTALAASGKITFSFANIALNGETKIAAGDTITVANGQQVPGSILYTDTAGGKTNYLPIRAICDLLGVDIDYDSASKTVLLKTTHWERVIDGKTVSYISSDETAVYDAPPAWHPAYLPDGWGVSKVQKSADNSLLRWDYESSEGSLRFRCCYPSTASLGRQMQSEKAVLTRQQVSVQGHSADYYLDGSKQLLVWENEDGLLFYFQGTDMEKESLMQIAESVAPSADTAPTYTLRWLPSDFSLYDRFAGAGTVYEQWLKDGVITTLICSSGPVGIPDDSAEAVIVNDKAAQYWPAETPHSGETGTITADGETISGSPAEVGDASIDSITIPGEKQANILIWADEDTGTLFRLQSTLDKDTMVRIANNVR